MFVYLAYPIDYANGQHLSAIVELSRRLSTRHTVFEPGTAFHTHGEPDERVQEVNHAALDRADALVAYYPDRNTVGVPMEVGRAIALGVPTCVIVGDETKASWSLVGSSAQVVTDCRQAVDWLKDVVPGERTYLSTTALEIEGTIEQVEMCAAVRKLGTGTYGQMPSRHHSGDAGFDLYVSEETWLKPQCFTNVRSHIAIEWPHGVWGLLVGRSSTFYKRGLIVNTAIIDNGFRGELFACVYNPGSDLLVEEGDRLAQIIPMPLLAPSIAMDWSDTLSPSDRGEGGFGSTGS